MGQFFFPFFFSFVCWYHFLKDYFDSFYGSQRHKSSIILKEIFEAFIWLLFHFHSS